MTELFIAGSGGHLMQLFLLSKRIPQRGRRLWISDRTPQSESLLEHEDVIFVPHQAPRSIFGLVRNALEIKKVYSGDVSRVYSTGAGIALSAIISRPLRMKQFVYIESATRISSFSLTGKIIDRLPTVKRYVQHEQLASNRWRYIGSVLDGFRAEPLASHSQRVLDPGKDDCLRVFVTVGANQHASFDTLIAHLLNLFPPQWDVHWQFGPSSLLPKDVQGASMMSYSAMVDHIQKADAVITHAGTGSILSILAEGRIPVVVPRSSLAGEHVDEHQTQLASYVNQHDLGIVRMPTEITIADVELASLRKSTESSEIKMLDL